MTHEHAIELLGNVICNISAREDTASQIEILQTSYGFTDEDLLEFGYTESDINNDYKFSKFSVEGDTYRLTGHGIRTINSYLDELKAKRKEILDAGKDEAENTNLPTMRTILWELSWQVAENEEEYINNWGVTDNYDSDYPLSLKLNVDYVRL